MDRVSIERMCAGREFQVGSADREKAREEKLLVMPAGKEICIGFCRYCQRPKKIVEASFTVVSEHEQNDRMFCAEAVVLSAQVETSIGSCDVTDDEVRAVADAESRDVIVA